MKKVMWMTVFAVMVAMMASAAVGQDLYFEDNFNGTSLDARWTQDISVENLTDPNFNNILEYPDGNPSIIIADGDVARANNTLSNCYNHLETPIDATGNFVVKAWVTGNNGITWGPLVSVYWHESCFVTAKARMSNFLASEFADPCSGFGGVDTTAAYGGWGTPVKMQIEFRDDVIMFFFQREGIDTDMVYYPALDIPRHSSYTGPATLIIGKGHQDASRINPDYDNDHTALGTRDDRLLIDDVGYLPISSFFEETFDDGGGLPAYWDQDHDPTYYSGVGDANHGTFLSEAESAPSVGFSMRADRPSARVYQYDYNHMETYIDATGQFAVQADIITTWGNTVGNLLAVYWDRTHYTSLVGPSSPTAQPFNSVHYNEPSYSEIVNTEGKTYSAGNWSTMRIEFWDDTIEFYAMVGADTEFTHLPSLSKPRPSDPNYYNHAALLIVGKGIQRDGAPTYPDSDFNNDNGGLGSQTGVLVVDNVIYESLEPACGDEPNYLRCDLNEDCYVNEKDIDKFSGEWLACSDPANSNCDQYWMINDTFDGPTLHKRWSGDYSPWNVADPNGAFVINGGVAEAMAYNFSYSHLETPIYASGNFEVQADVHDGVDVAFTSWGGGLAVYWDETHFISLMTMRARRLYRNVYDGSSFTGLQYPNASFETYPGWGSWATMKIVFDDTTVKFYADASIDPCSTGLVYLPDFDMARAPWMEVKNALLIVGKGRQDNTTYTNPDFDNDHSMSGTLELLMVDNVSYQVTSSHTCAEMGQGFFASDINGSGDCYVNMTDFAEIALQWLWCSDPANSACEAVFD